MTDMFEIAPIGWVHASRQQAEDDHWGQEQFEIELTEAYPPEALAGLESFSHVEVIYCFHQVAPDKIQTAARHPRNNPDWPKVGIFAQRGKNRPNRLGCTMARVLSVEGRRLKLADLDAIDGTPVIDLKPVMREFLPQSPVEQPQWASELMRDYWG